jgi:hypothetical protein
MSPLPVLKFAELIETHGPAILEEPERCRGWLVYSCPDQKKEVNVLLSALAQRVPQDLRASGQREALVRRLVDDWAMTEDAALWAVESWEMILRQIYPAGLPSGHREKNDNAARRIKEGHPE